MSQESSSDNEVAAGAAAEPAPAWPEKLVGSILYNGYNYTLNNKRRGARGTFTGYYRCSHFRKPHYCKATFSLQVDENGKSISEEKGAHACNEKKDTDINDVQEEMRELCERKSMGDMSRNAKDIAREVLAETQTAHAGMLFNKHFFFSISNLSCLLLSAGEGIITLQEHQLVEKVYACRNQHNSHWEAAIRTINLNSINPEDKRRFLRFHMMIEVDGSYQNIVGWAHPLLSFKLCDASVHLFLDATFSCCPEPFYQCLIIMAYLPAYATYVPVFYILMTAKSEHLYQAALQQVISACQGKLRPRSVTMDFEMAIVNVVNKLLVAPAEAEGRNCFKVACVFHWLQAMKRKLKALHLPNQQTSELVQHLRLLTVIPIPDIETRGIPYIRNSIVEEPYQEIYASFWSYFNNTWLRGAFGPESWNLYTLLGRNDTEEILVNLTNNALERFNGVLNSSFPGAGRPPIEMFINTIRDLSISAVDNLQNIEAGRTRQPDREPPHIPEIPIDYPSYL